MDRTGHADASPEPVTVASSRCGRLVVVGTGIQLSAHMTPLATSHMEQADKVLYLVTDLLAKAWIAANTSSAESLEQFYAVGKNRAETYEEMVEYILSFVRGGLCVCVAVYGHPGVFTYPTHESIRRAREEGFEATMLPGISAEDCLFADLGIDPANAGCQSYEATDFLVHDRGVDTTSSLVLWQIGAVGNLEFVGKPHDDAVAILIETLVARYGPQHPVVLYVASPHPIVPPAIRRLPLKDVPTADICAMSTLYVPPLGPPRVNLDMARRLGLAALLKSHAAAGAP